MADLISQIGVELGLGDGIAVSKPVANPDGTCILEILTVVLKQDDLL